MYSFFCFSFLLWIRRLSNIVGEAGFCPLLPARHPVPSAPAAVFVSPPPTREVLSQSSECGADRSLPRVEKTKKEHCDLLVTTATSTEQILLTPLVLSDKSVAEKRSYFSFRINNFLSFIDIKVLLAFARFCQLAIPSYLNRQLSSFRRLRLGKSLVSRRSAAWIGNLPRPKTWKRRTATYLSQWRRQPSLTYLLHLS